jgi:hypothetical protein
MPGKVITMAEFAELMRLKENARVQAEWLIAFRHLLASEKFQGVDGDGGRKDWISVADVLRWLHNLEDMQQ